MTTLMHEEVRYYLHADQEQLSAVERAELDSHLAGCAECRSYAAECAALRSALARAMRTRWDASRPAPGLEHNIRARLERRKAPRRILSFAMSAVALLALALFLRALFTVTGESPVPTPSDTPTSTPPPTPDAAFAVTSVSFWPDPTTPLDRTVNFDFGAAITVTSQSNFIGHVVAFPVLPGETPSECAARTVPTDRLIWANQQEFPPGQHTFTQHFRYSDAVAAGADRLVIRTNVIEPGVNGRLLYCVQQVYRLSSAVPPGATPMPAPALETASPTPVFVTPTPPLDRPASPTSTPGPEERSPTPLPTFTPGPTSETASPTPRPPFTPPPTSTPGPEEGSPTPGPATPTPTPTSVGSGGVIGQWQNATPLPSARMDFALVRSNANIYLVGGCITDCFEGPTQAVEKASILSNGDLGTWQSVNQLTTRRQGPAAVISGNYLYVLGGADGQALNSVERAPINSDGSLGSWELVNSMTQARFRFAANVIGDYLYAVGGFGSTTSGELNTVERALINVDGTLGTWQPAPSLTTGRLEFGSFVSGNYVYALGGEGQQNGSWVSLDTIERAPINPDGSIGSWQVVTSMPLGRHAFAAAYTDGDLYVLGGNSMGNPTLFLSSVDKISVNPDGSIGSWQSMPSMLVPRHLHGAVVVGTYLYAMGGYNQTIGGLKSIERATITVDTTPPMWQSR